MPIWTTLFHEIYVERVYSTKGTQQTLESIRTRRRSIVHNQGSGRQRIPERRNVLGRQVFINEFCSNRFDKFEGQRQHICTNRFEVDDDHVSDWGGKIRSRGLGEIGGRGRGLFGDKVNEILI